MMRNRPQSSFDELLDAALQEWPDRIDVGEGNIFDEDSGNFPALVDIKDRIEERLVSSGKDDLMDINWAIFTAFNKYAMGSTVVCKRFLRGELVRFFFERNKS